MIAFRWNCTSRRQSQPIKGGHWYCTVSTQCVSLPTAANTNSPWEYTRIIFKFNILLRVLDCLCVFCHSPLTAIESTEEASTMFGCHRIFTTLVCIQFSHHKIGFVFIDPIRPVGQLLNVHRTVFPMIEVTVILCYAKVQTKRHTKKKNNSKIEILVSGIASPTLTSSDSVDAFYWNRPRSPTPPSVRHFSV